MTSYSALTADARDGCDVQYDNLWIGSTCATRTRNRKWTVRSEIKWFLFCWASAFSAKRFARVSPFLIKSFSLSLLLLLLLKLVWKSAKSARRTQWSQLIVIMSRSLSLPIPARERSLWADIKGCDSYLVWAFESERQEQYASAQLKGKSFAALHKTWPTHEMQCRNNLHRNRARGRSVRMCSEADLIRLVYDYSRTCVKCSWETLRSAMLRSIRETNTTAYYNVR